MKLAMELIFPIPTLWLSVSVNRIHFSFHRSIFALFTKLSLNSSVHELSISIIPDFILFKVSSIWMLLLLLFSSVIQYIGLLKEPATYLTTSVPVLLTSPCMLYIRKYDKSNISIYMLKVVLSMNVSISVTN